MRYQETGEVHLDFHGAVNATVEYLVQRFGEDAPREIFYSVGKNVYKDLREHLERGDTEELVNHWRHFLDREKADYRIDRNDGEIVLTIRECPAVRRVRELGLKPAPLFCEQTFSVNRGLCENSDYEITTRKTGEGSCVQTLRRRHHDSL